MLASNPIRVSLMHRDPFTQAGLTATFAKSSDIQLADPEEAEVPVETSHPRWREPIDVVVADFAGGVEVARQGNRLSPSRRPKIVIIESCARECEIRKALELGVQGYVVIGCGLDHLVSSVRSVHLGIAYLCPAVTRKMAESMSWESLTHRETEVLRLVADGLCNKVIAARLDIAVGTVKSHLKGVFEKLGVQSRTQAILAAERRGILPPVSDRIAHPMRHLRASPAAVA